MAKNRQLIKNYLRNTMIDKRLDLFFTPKSIAVFGASENKYSYGHRYIQAMQDYGYKGKLYAINRKGDKVLGHKIYRTLAEIPGKIDQAFITIPSQFVADALKECIEKDVKAAVLFTGGFSEAGKQGRDMEKEVLDIARGHMRLMGPNCFGPYCPKGGVTVFTGSLFSKETGPVAMTAQYA